MESSETAPAAQITEQRLFKVPDYIPPLLERLLSHAAVTEPVRTIRAQAQFTAETLGWVPEASERDVERAVTRARVAQSLWAARPPAERARIFLKFHDLLLKRREEILDLIQIETGKARLHALEELIDTAAVARYYALRAGRYLRAHRRRGVFPFFTKVLELHVPIGVVGFISPWNYPLTLAITDAIPALIAGNTAVIKPDHQTSFTALWAAALLREAGLPREALQVITGDGSVVGPMLTSRVDYVMFTGSTNVGRTVAGQAAERLVGCSLELGGKNPMIVLPDADFDAAIEGALRGCFVGAGQVCISIERLYVHQSLFGRFSAQLAARARSLRLGAALDYSMDVGSLISERQLRTTEAHVRDAMEKGAFLLAGGRRRPDLGPYFYEPTILAGVREGMRVFDEETFGPVVSVYEFASDDEAVDLANATPYGLSASVWTRKAARALAVASRISAGAVNVNDPYAAAWVSSDAPLGGMKQSGLGRRHGSEGILKFTESQIIAAQRLIPLAPAYGVTPGVWANVMAALLKAIRRTRLLG